MRLKFGFFVGLLLFIFPHAGEAYEPENRPFITCWLRSGQLGNQLFEIATTLAFAWDNDMDPIFPELNTDFKGLPFNRDRIFFRLNSSPLPRPILHTFKHLLNYEKLNIPVRPDQNLVGLFQTWEYFDHHRERILDIFAPHPDELAYLKTKHAELLNHPCTVGVHVRTFNKHWGAITPFVGLKYFDNAMKYFPPEALFVVFSDRINWCKHHFAKFNRPMIFIDDQDHIEDLFLMSMLKHNIISNSSFSWWAAYFNKNPDKVVVAPYYFVHPHALAKVNANLPGWIVLKTDYNYSTEPYPVDICDYDDVSKSIDTQCTSHRS